VRSTLAILLISLILGIGASFAPLKLHCKPLLDPEPMDNIFALVPPQVKNAEETITAQAVPSYYLPQETILAVTGDMILAYVNKEFALPSWYVPPDLVPLDGQVKTTGTALLRRDAVADLKALIEDAEKICNCDIAVISAYRSYQTQAITHNYWVNKVGQYAANRGSARPGHSEHQLGTTVDLASSTTSYQLIRDFGYTKEGIWLNENAHNYGFVLSYPQGKEAVTGYIWEPWHFRWVGQATATEVYRRGITLEEYLSR